MGPSGQVSVLAAKGTVGFAAHGKEVTVTAGTESTAAPGSGPDDPEPIPEQLLLSVIWPELDRPESVAQAALTGQVAGQVTGRVRPSSRVKVNGVETAVQADGRFAARVPVAVGENRLDVEAQDILGRKKTVSKVVKRPAPAPALETSPEDLWKR
jgi:hypothetical protein